MALPSRPTREESERLYDQARQVAKRYFRGDIGKLILVPNIRRIKEGMTLFLDNPLPVRISNLGTHCYQENNKQPFLFLELVTPPTPGGATLRIPDAIAIAGFYNKDTKTTGFWSSGTLDTLFMMENITPALYQCDAKERRIFQVC